MKWKRMFWAIGFVVGVPLALIILMVLILVTHVENWSRDLSVNVASTAEGHKDERLRPIQTSVGGSEAVAAIEKVAQSLPRWQLEGSPKTEGNKSVIHFVRTTGLVGYKDDIDITVTENEAGSLIEGESKSRVGKGDLGQNPRNLREIFVPLKKTLFANTK